jgi:transcription initiation factor TFIIIB Brf1 subunit/transcription initiation factor TFIIB
MAHYQTGCPDCNGFFFVDDYHSGDTICKNCGLVVSERMIMDDISYYPAFDGEGPSFEHNESLAHSDKYNNPKIKSMLKRCISVLGFCESVEDVARDIFLDVCSKQIFRGHPLKAIMAASIYISCLLRERNGLRRDAREIYNSLKIDRLVFFKGLKTIYKIRNDLYVKISSVQENDTLYRQIATIDDIPNDLYMAIKTKVMVYDDLRKKKGLLMGSPPVIVNAVLIFVACESQGLKMNKTKYLQYGWVSRATLDKHARAISGIVADANC